MSVDPNSFRLLLVRPNEGIFTKRGTTVFDVPEEFLTDRYKPIGAELQQRFGENVDQRIPLKGITQPDLTFTEPIPRDGSFSLFIQKHKVIAGELITIFLDADSAANFLSTAAFVRDRINPSLFNYAFSVAMAHRPDTQNISLPSIANVFPDQFIDSSVFPKAREEQALAENTRTVIDIPINYTASEREPEQRCAYFREDIGVNLHHWHWHLVYPGEGDDRIVKKDRRGELFYYMHSQLMNRYDIERICNGLKRVVPLNDLHAIVPEAYYPKIIRSANNKAFPPRIANAKLLDINRPEDAGTILLSEMELWRDRFLQLIDEGTYIDGATNQRIQLDEETGIDVLGNILEASKLSPNREFYGDLHSKGHILMSYVHDPENRYLESYGTIGDVATAMRDPIFYRWHRFVDNCLNKYKNTLPPYNLTQLGFDGVTVNTVNVQITRGRNPAPNILLTYWQRSELDLSAGLDFGPQGNVFARFTHLQYAPFEYNISVMNNGAQRRGTCRIFMCPVLNEIGTQIPFRDTRSLIIEMDKFTVNLNPGENTIRRSSKDSNVTIPYERSFRNIGQNSQPTNADQLSEFQFCGCGWPDHMLLPRGTPEGASFNICVMISNYDDDFVTQNNTSVTSKCDDAASFCGLRDRLYPDRRAMGFPFDRSVNFSRINTLEAFIAQSPNMGLGQCTIRFNNTVIDK